MIVLIPCYEPGEQLIELIQRVGAAAPEMVVVLVDDGSGPAYRELFDRAETYGCVRLSHERNRGKGRALKTGFRYIEQHYPAHPVVCADCDGQHTVADIVNVARHAAGGIRIVLGARRLDADVPFKSRLGNGLTRVLFAATTGEPVTDTQTGLRAYPPRLLGWLQTVPGDRFEFELEVLLRARAEGIQIAEVPIATVYLDGNASTHFRPLVDSARVYAPLVKFSLSSLLAAAIDAALLFGLHALWGNLLAAVVVARVVSATVNFAVNRSLVFGRGRPLGSALRYAALVAVILAANATLLHLLHVVVGLGLFAAKLLTEITLFVTSYQVQKLVVFQSGATAAAPADSPEQTNQARSARS